MTHAEAITRLGQLSGRRDHTAKHILERYRVLRETLGIVAALEQAEAPEWDEYTDARDEPVDEDAETERLIALEEQRIEDGPWTHLQ